MKQQKNIMKKVCVIGDEAVGKTSLIRRFVVDRFEDKYIATIGSKNSKKNLVIKSGETTINLTMIIWDILGQKRFNEIKKSAYRGANGAFIVIDLTRLETLRSFDEWLTSLYGVAPDIPVVVLANKKDLKAQYGVEEIRDVVRGHSFPFYLTSAKTGESVNLAFRTLGNMMLKSNRKLTPNPVESPEPSSYTEKTLSALDVEDIIMTRYCELLGDPDIAMAIIRAQFKRANLNFKEPTIHGLEQMVDFLIKAASDHVEASRLAKEGRVYTDLIKSIGIQGEDKNLHS